MTSRAVQIPPMPMIGICIADLHSCTMRTAIGLIAGPLSPPKMFDSCGRRVSTSIDIARKVFTKETASAPACSAAFAILAISVTLGLSLGKIGSLVVLRTANNFVCSGRITSERDTALFDVGA